MCCNSQIHDELKNIGEATCPFCDILLEEGEKVAESCCSEQYIEHNNDIYVCVNCGIVHSYEFQTEYLDYYENMHRIHRKSVYHRKYHIENVLNDLCYDRRVELTHFRRDQIYKVFAEIGTILPLVNKTRKRMISVNFIMRRIFDMMGLPFNHIPISKSRKTLAFYDKYWAKIISLIGDNIKTIIQ